MTIYDQMATRYQADRARTLYEKPALDRFLGVVPRNQARRRVLDLGCGPGAPIATYLADRQVAMTGVDAAQAMAALYAQTLPRADIHHTDMRGLDLGQRFDGILAWDSLCHLPPEDQAALFPTLAAHAAPGAALMFTTGPEAGTTYSMVGDLPVYRASLSADAYHQHLQVAGFDLLDHRVTDRRVNGRKIWLARYAGD